MGDIISLKETEEAKVFNVELNSKEISLIKGALNRKLKRCKSGERYIKTHSIIEKLSKYK